MLAHAFGAKAPPTEPTQNGSMSVDYAGPPGTIKVTHFPGEGCLVVADAVEIVVTSPLIQIESLVRQPALDIELSVKALRHPVNFSETTAVQLSWHATGVTVDGSTDPSCDGSAVVLFNVTVTEKPPPPPTVANVAAPATTPTDPVSLADRKSTRLNSSH